jgi:TonB family protein
MNTGVSPPFSQETSPKRSVPRYKLAVPLDLTVLRSGIPNHISGHAFEIGEGGMGVVPASQLLVGESVRVEFPFPHMDSPVHATAVVRYQRERRFGLQFLRLPVEQQSMVSYWTRRQGELLLAPADDAMEGVEEEAPQLLPDLEDATRKSGRVRIVALVVFIIVISAGLGWWHWQQRWAELEAKLPANDTAALQPQWTVPPDVMAQRIVYHVTPEYPEFARQAALQGTVVLDAVVSKQGAVTQMRFVSGPDALSQAAMDAVRWWRYEPYLVDGQAATVETTVAVDFRPAN